MSVYNEIHVKKRSSVLLFLKKCRDKFALVYIKFTLTNVSIYIYILKD